MVADAELALDRNGKILGLRVDGKYALGAYLGASAIVPLAVTAEVSPLPTLDSTRLLARAAIRRSIEGPAA